jgi:succinate dehydrogenase / fumarate reductase, flavoprotein subunit
MSVAAPLVATTGVTREELPPIPSEIAALMGEVYVVGKLVE